MKKTLSLILAVLMLAMCLCACETKKENTSYIVLEEALEAEEYGIGFRNEDIALGMAVQETLEAMIEDGAAAEISKKWFGEDILFKNAEYKEDTTIPEGDNSLQAILDKGTFVLGLDDSFPPMGYRDDNNNIVGFDIDLATEVCERLGVELVVQPIDWDSKEMELSTGKIDCIWNGMTITDERVETMFIPAAYIANRQVIIVGNNSGITKKIIFTVFHPYHYYSTIFCLNGIRILVQHLFACYYNLRFTKSTFAKAGIYQFSLCKLITHGYIVCKYFRATLPQYMNLGTVHSYLCFIVSPSTLCNCCRCCPNTVFQHTII